MGLKQIKLTIVYSLLIISASHAQNVENDKHIEVSLRMIGHQVLLNAHDSTSRVSPIVREKNGYRIQFEAEFAFDPDELVNTVNRVIRETQIANGYIMEVVECETGQVVYSYEVGDLENIDIIPCKARNQPRACYSLLFTLIEPTEDLRADSPSISVQPPSKSSQAIYLVVALSILLIVVVFFLWRRRRKLSIDSNFIQLGKYRFDRHNSALILEEQRIALSSKEADLLLLLYDTVNNTVEREVILNVVWGDEGDYVGRTLDVFISKLRKKLEADASVRIVNIRGIGYKLLVNI